MRLKPDPPLCGRWLLGRWRIAWVLLFVTSMGSSAWAEVMKMLVPEYLPYTGTVDGKAGGFGVEKVREVFRRAGLEMQVQVVPNYARCVSEVRAGAADGFFLGSRNRERDAVAVMTDAIMINNWIWLLPKGTTRKPADADFVRTASVGVMLNTNPHAWLRDNGYLVGGTTKNAASLLNMLDAGRLDAVLVPELVIQNALQTSGKRLDDYQSHTHSRQPFGIYISKQFIRQNPGVVDQINDAIRRQP